MLRAQDFNRHLSNEWFDYNLCEACGTVSIDRVPADLARYYPAEYYPLPANATELATLAEHERYKLDIITRFVKTGRLLEIGPGAGGFAHLARAAGFDVQTVEMDARTCEFLRSLVGVQAVQSTDPAETVPGLGRFDVVAMWHALEHLPKPCETLEAVARALRPAGVLVIAVPNPDSLQFRLFRSRWTHLDAPRHLALIPAGAIRDRAKAWSLSAEMETSTDVGGLGWNHYGWEKSLRSNLLGRAVARAARPVERRDLRGATYTIVLRKTAA